MMDLKQTLGDYFKIFPNDKPRLTLLREQIERGDTMNDPGTLPGHCTGAAIVLSPDLSKVLMVHHNFLDRWLQPGGHWELHEADLLEAARREAVEETKVQLNRYLPIDADRPLVPLQIDTHHIPANDRKNMPAHYHHDFRYAFVAVSEDLQIDVEEVKDSRWMALNASEAAEIAEALRRLKSIMQPDRVTHIE